MTEPLPDTWHWRDLPVLRIAVQIFDNDPGTPVRVADIESALDLSVEDIQRACLALAGGGYLTAQGVPNKRALRLSGFGGPARRAAGSWPSADGVADRLLATLNELAVNTTDPVEKGRLRKAADAVGSLTRDTLVSVAGAAAGVAMQ